MLIRVLTALTLALALLGGPTVGWAAGSVVDRIQCTATNTSPITKNTTITNSNSPMFAGIVWRGAVTITSVTWNGTGMTVVDTSGDGGNFANTAIYKLLAPTSGTHDLVVTFSANPTTSTCFAFGTAGGDTTVGVRTIYKRNTTNGTGPGTTVADSQNGDIVFHVASVFASAIAFDAPEDTTGTEDDALQGGSPSGGFSTQTASGANTAVGCTDQTTYSEIAFAMPPLAVAATPAQGFGWFFGVQ